MYSVSAAMMQRSQSIKNQELIGVVESNKHPDGSKNGLIQIRIRGIHDDWDTKHLPWQKSSNGFGAGDKDITEFEEIPAVGTKVYCRSEDGSQYHMT